MYEIRKFFDERGQRRIAFLGLSKVHRKLLFETKLLYQSSTDQNKPEWVHSC
jgi:hypothetical protein